MEPVFLNFERSSAERRGYPIEIGWAFVDGRCERHLIHPAPEWLSPPQTWDTNLGMRHGLTLETLLRQGELARNVSIRMNAELAGKVLYCEVPELGAHQVRMLFDASGIPVEIEIAAVSTAAGVAAFAQRQGIHGEAFAWAELEATRLVPRARWVTDAALRWATLWQLLSLGAATLDERRAQKRQPDGGIDTDDESHTAAPQPGDDFSTGHNSRRDR